MKSLKLQDNFSSPTVVNEAARVAKTKRTARATITGQVQPKQDVSSPALADGATTGEKQADQLNDRSDSIISSIKPYDPKNDLIDEADDISATRFVCNYTESPSKQSAHLEQTHMQD